MMFKRYEKYVRVHIRRLGFVLKSMRYYGAGVLTILLGYVVLTGLPQGEDLVMQAGEFWGSFFGSSIAVISWSFFLWYSSRLLGYEKKFIDPKWPLDLISTIPRLLAYNAFATVQIAVIALPTFLDLHFWWIFALVFVFNVYYFLLSKILNKQWSQRWQHLLVASIAVGYISVLLYSIERDSLHQLTLPWIAILFFVFQTGSLYFFVRRRVTLDDTAGENYPPKAIGFVRIFSWKVIRVPAWFEDREQQTFRFFNIVAVVAILCYCVAFTSIGFADVIGPLTVVLLAFGILSGFANIITYFSLRLRLNLFVVLLLLGWLIGEFVNPYEVRLINSRPGTTVDKRPTLISFFASWIAERREELDSLKENEKYPVFVVLADGGASRSGYWVASVLSAWQDESMKSDIRDSFGRHLLCLSGASGGSVGNATFYTLLANDGVSSFLEEAKYLLKQDFLSHSIAHFFGPDILRHFLPIIRAGDRAGAIEETLEYWSERRGWEKNFNTDVKNIFDTSGKLPLLFINTTRIQGGAPGIISPVKVNDFTNRIDVLNSVSAQDHGSASIRLSTASILGARFPYISPAGSIGDEFFVDGGYFDNSGAGIVYEMMYYLDSLMSAEYCEEKKKLDFRLIHIVNNPDSKKDTAWIHPLANDLAAPLLTVFNTYSSQTSMNDTRLENYFQRRASCDNCTRDINLYRTGQCESYPMNWVISNYQLDRMDDRLDEIKQPFADMRRGD